MGISPQPAGLRRLIVNADDFGRSPSINEAVVQAHQNGILTTASLMVNGEAAQAAAEAARENPRLGVGLDLTLICGTSTLSPDQIPGLVDAAGRFGDDPVTAGMAYAFRRRLRTQLRQEVRAQLEKFRATGLPLDHVNGHLHLHLHPTVLPILGELANEFDIRHVRLTRDPLRLNLQIARGRYPYRLLHSAVFGLLSRHARPAFARHRWRHTDRVFGLLQNARVDTAYVRRLLPRLPPGDSELYSHPSLDQFPHELEALVDPHVRDMVRHQGLRLIRYQDL